jgi:hypothetical protein
MSHLPGVTKNNVLSASPKMQQTATNRNEVNSMATNDKAASKMKSFNTKTNALIDYCIVCCQTVVTTDNDDMCDICIRASFTQEQE